jgi:hypothetical protein
MSAVNYRLELPTQWSIHPVFHTDLLTPYKETIMHGPNFTRPTPELIDGEEEYTVEKILDSRRFSRRQCLQYLVKWEGYPDSDNMWIDKDDVFADDKLQEFKVSNPEAETHLRKAHVVSIPYSPIHIPHHLHHHLISYPMDAVAPCPLVDQSGMVITRTTPSPTPPQTLSFVHRVETPASWPLSDDMGIETHTPTYIPSCSPSPGDIPWRPIIVGSRPPSPFMPGGPRVTPSKGVEAVPIAEWGSNPGSPVPGTPEYNYDLTSPPSPLGSTSSSSSSLLSTSHSPVHASSSCSDHCFDVTCTLHHHDHSPSPSDKTNVWTTATLIEEPALKNKRVWAYGMTNKQKDKWMHLDQWEGWEEEDLESLRALFADAIKDSPLRYSVVAEPEKGMMSWLGLDWFAFSYISATNRLSLGLLSFIIFLSSPSPCAPTIMSSDIPYHVSWCSLMFYYVLFLGSVY